MDYNKKPHDEIVSLVQKFVQDYYQLRARHIKDADVQMREKTNDVKRNDQQANNPDEAIKQ